MNNLILKMIVIFRIKSEKNILLKQNKKLLMVLTIVVKILKAIIKNQTFIRKILILEMELKN